MEGGFEIHTGMTRQFLMPGKVDHDFHDLAEYRATVQIWKLINISNTPHVTSCAQLESRDSWQPWVIFRPESATHY